jgi:hypothetical protein
MTKNLKPRKHALSYSDSSSEDSSIPSREEISRVMAALGRIGGPKGGRARAAKLSGKRRSDIAKRAAMARWSNSNRNKEE